MALLHASPAAGVRAVAPRRAGAALARRVDGLYALPARAPRRADRRRGVCAPLCAAGVAHPGEESLGSGTFPGRSAFGPALSVPGAAVAAGGVGGGFASEGMGSTSALGAVMERAKMNFVMPTPVQSAPKLDDSGSGGDDGKHLNNGGGGGDGGGDDDDDYFGEGEGDGEGEGNGEGGWLGDSLFRAAVPESYDALSIRAVLAE